MNELSNNESAVEKHLHNLITKAGGTTRKWVSPHHIGVPDRIVFYCGRVEFVEIKTVIGKLSSMQEREHERLTSHGATVRTIYGMKDAEDYVTNLILRVRNG